MDSLCRDAPQPSFDTSCRQHRQVGARPVPRLCDLDRRGTATVVHVSPVLDRHDLDDQSVILDPVEHPILAPTRGVQRGKRLTQRSAQTPRVVRQRPDDELERRSRNRFRKRDLERTSRRLREDDGVGAAHPASRPRARIAARTGFGVSGVDPECAQQRDAGDHPARVELDRGDGSASVGAG